MKGVPARPASATGLIAVVAAVAWAHTVLRGAGWAYEWTWALFQYQLVVLLVAPLVAGAAAWEAVALRPSADSVRSSGRSAGFAVVVIGRLMACITLGLAVGVIPTVVIVWRVRGIDVPPLEAVFTVGPAASQLLMVAATSFALATCWPRAAVVPLLAVGWFVGLIAANVALPEQVARVGGATASLLGLHIPPATQLIQAAVPLGVAVSAAGLVWASSVRGTPKGLRRAAVVVPLVLIGLLVGSVSGGRGLFERSPVETTCVGEHPTWCLAEAYVGAVGTLRDRTRRAFHEIDAVGATPPRRITQGRAGRTTVETILHGDRSLTPAAVVYAWLSLDCQPSMRSLLLDDLTLWVDYLRARAAGQRSPAGDAEAALLRAAAERIVVCEGR